MTVGKVTPFYSKIDNAATDGLAGTANSLAYRVHEIEKHFHSPERWVGKRAVQDATDWGTPDVLTSFQAISGNNTYGADANDEAQVIGTGDAPIITGMVKFDFHKLLVTDVSVATEYKLRIVYGSGTMAAAITAEQYSEVMFMLDKTKNISTPIELMMPRLTSGTDKVWVQAWNATDNATVDFVVALHEYAG